MLFFCILYPPFCILPFMSLSLRSATPDDLGRLAVLNKRLIEDEKSANPMSLEAAS